MIRGPIAQATIRTTAVLGLKLAVQATALLLVARILGPHQFGGFAGISSLALTLGSLSSLGMNLVLLSGVSRTPACRQEILRYAVPTTILCGGILLASYLALCQFVLQGAGVSFIAVLAIGVTEMWLQPLFGLPAAEHLALGRTASSQCLTVLPLALRAIAALAVFLLRPDNPLNAYVGGYLSASLIALAFVTPTMPGSWPRIREWRLPSRIELGNAAGYAALNATAIGPAELDKTLAARFLPLSAAGLYAAGARIMGAVVLPVHAMMLAALPRLFREGKENLKRTERLLRWIFCVTTAYSLLLSVALWFVAPAFNWLFGRQYNGLGMTIQWLCIAVPGLSLRLAAGSALMALGKPWMRAGFEIVGLIVLFTTAEVLTSAVGLMGMPVSLACSEWVMAAMGWALILKRRKS